MRGEELKEFLRKNKITQSEMARRLNTTHANFGAMLTSDDVKSGLLERIAAAMGRDVPYIYGFDTRESVVIGNNTTAIKGDQNNINSDAFVSLLKKKDEQIDRLLAIIERSKL